MYRPVVVIVARVGLIGTVSGTLDFQSIEKTWVRILCCGVESWMTIPFYLAMWTST